MKLLLQGHDERYTVEQSLLNLFPGELPVYEPILPGDDSWAVVTLREEDDCCHVSTELRWQGRQTSHREVLPLSGTEYAREGQRRHAVGACFFLAAQAVSGVRPPWGMLTGVRPDKPATAALAAGRTPEETRAWMERFYYVSPDRAALAVETASAALRASCRLERRDIAVYVGIPFCPTRCAYCSFVSQDMEHAKKLMDPYFQLLLEEIEKVAQVTKDLGLSLVSVYIGGGTPTTLSARQLSALCGKIRQVFDFSRCGEFTVEAGRPDTITGEKLLALREEGISRISINPQSLSDQVLRNIGRRHTAQDVVEAFRLAQRLGFSNINADLIVGLPGDDLASFQHTLNGVLQLGASNVTVHSLAIKRSAWLNSPGGDLSAHSNAQEAAAMVDYSIQRLTQEGFEPYYLYRQTRMAGNLENTGWAKPGSICRYNIYTMDESNTVIACGAGGVSKVKDPYSGRLERIFNFKLPLEYINRFPEILQRKDGVTALYEQFRQRLR